MSTAEVYQFPARQLQTASKDIRVADCEDGYTRLANDILEMAYKVRLNGNAMSVLLAVIRLTYGWNKSRDRIAGVQLADETGLSESEVSRAVAQLLERHIIEAEGDKRKIKTIGINRRVDEWILRKPARSVAQTHNSDCANTQVGLRKPANTKDISPKTLNQRQDKDLLGVSAEKSAQPPEQEKIPIEATVHERRGKTLFWGNADDQKCANWLSHLRAKAFTAKGLSEPKAPDTIKWVNEVRLMRQHDQRSHHDICELFLWVCKTGRELEFCQGPKKLRDKWDELLLRKANSERGVNQRPLSNLEAAQLAAREALESGRVSYDDNTIL